MKWYLGITQETLPNYADMIRVALYSAKLFTNLRPYVLFDGDPCVFTEYLDCLGVTVIFNRLSFDDQIKAAQERYFPHWDHYMKTARGAFQRLDIPMVEQEEEYVLYTDCDVVFNATVSFDHLRPDIFSVAPQFRKDGHKSFEINSGIMIMNVPRLRRDLAAIIELGCEIAGSEGLGYDQEFLEKFYRGRWDPLPLTYNWKPYWGVNNGARIIHWHGPKPETVSGLLEQNDYPANELHKSLFEADRTAYSHYLKQWSSFERYAPQI